MKPKTLAAEYKTIDPDAKTISEADDVIQLGKKGLGDDFDGSLEDSEINGASSLLKMQESGSLKGLESVLDYIDKNEKRGCTDDLNADLLDANLGAPDGNTDDEREGEMDVEDVQGRDFEVGDFVWGKIRSHPWWPGRIYDPLDASDHAKKIKQRDKILVAYFGDGTFAWCNPSQLSPFEENFMEMLKQNSSKSFVNAVEKAVDEVGRLVDLKMTCSCVPQENLIGFGRSLAVNAGIKEGLLVPEGGIEKFSSTLFEPAAFLLVLKDIAQVAYTANMLEVAVFKNWLSAFYRAKGGYQLATYHEPQPIPGLENDTRNWIMDLNNYSGGVEARIHGPVEDDWLSSLSGPKFDQIVQSPLQKCQGIPEDIQYRRRKKKSIAEILQGDTAAEAESKEDDMSEEEMESRRQTSSTKRKTKTGKVTDKVLGQDMDAETQNEVRDVAFDTASSDKHAYSSGRKRRNDIDEADCKGKSKLGPGVKAGRNLDEFASSCERKKRKASHKADVEGKGKVRDVSEAGTNSGRTASSFRNKTKKVSDKNDADGLSEEGNFAKAGTNSEKYASSSVAKKGEISDNVNADGGNDLFSKAKWKMMPSDSLVSTEKNLSDLEVGSSGVEGERRKKHLSRARKIGSSTVEAHDADSNIEETRDITVSAKKMYGDLSVLSEGDESKVLTEKGSFSRERRQSKYLSPPYMNPNTGQRKRERESECRKVLGEARFGEQMSSGGDSAGPPTPKQDHNNTVDLMKVEEPVDQVLSQVRSLALNPTCFKEGNSLDMVEEFVFAFRSSVICNKSNQKMHNKHQPGRKRKSLESEPGTSRMEQNQADQSSADYKSRSTKMKKSEEAKLGKPKIRLAASDTDTRTNGKELDGETPASGLSQLNYIRQKLEMMTSMLETSGGKKSLDMQSKLEGEIRGLLEKVSTMIGSSS